MLAGRCRRDHRRRGSYDFDATASSASTSPTRSPVGATVACSTAIASAPMLGHVETHFAPGLLAPFGVAFGPDGKHAFVDSLINSSAPPSRLTPMRDASGISEYSIAASGLVSERVGSFPDVSLVGMAVSPNGRDLVAVGGSGASVFSVSRIEQPNSAPSRGFSDRSAARVKAPSKLPSHPMATTCSSASKTPTSWPCSI